MIHRCVADGMKSGLECLNFYLGSAAGVSVLRTWVGCLKEIQRFAA